MDPIDEQTAWLKQCVECHWLRGANDALVEARARVQRLVEANKELKAILYEWEHNTIIPKELVAGQQNKIWCLQAKLEIALGALRSIGACDISVLSLTANDALKKIDALGSPGSAKSGGNTVEASANPAAGPTKSWVEEEDFGG